MGDWENWHYHPGFPVISTFNADCCVRSASTPSSRNWWSANRANYVPLRITQFYHVKQLWCFNGAVVNGNFDIGIFSKDGARLTHTGSTAQAGINQPQKVAADLWLPPGLYVLGMSMDNNTGEIFSYGDIIYAMQGYCTENSAFPLPAQATFATYADTYMPLFGIASRDLV